MAERRSRSKAAASRPETPRADATEAKAATREESAQRVERLRTRVSKLRIRGWSLDGPRLLMILGGALLLLGLSFIWAAWYGAAHTPYLFEQVPYLISGGLIGLGMTFVGGSFYFAYWMTRQVQETKRQAQATQAVLERIEVALRQGGGAGNGASAPPDGRPSKQSNANGAFVATAKGTMFHRPDCPVVAGRSDLKRVSEGAKGLEPCRMCDPLAAVSV